MRARRDVRQAAGVGPRPARGHGRCHRGRPDGRAGDEPARRPVRPQGHRNAGYLWSSSRPSIGLGVDPFETLSVVDYGDVEVTPSYPELTHRAIRRAVTEVMTAGAIPIVLAGDHSIAHPDVGAVADHLRPESLGLIHFDAHADDAYEEPRLSHGTPLRLLVEEGSIRGRHIVQVGLRGYWPRRRTSPGLAGRASAGTLCPLRDHGAPRASDRRGGPGRDRAPEVRPRAGA
ncbi:MAG: arginase family protein, partial [Actinomycetota bacterium]